VLSYAGLQTAVVLLLCFRPAHSQRPTDATKLPSFVSVGGKNWTYIVLNVSSFQIYRRRQLSIVEFPLQRDENSTVLSRRVERCELGITTTRRRAAS